MLFEPKEHGDDASMFDRLPIKARLAIEIYNSGFVPFLQSLFSSADQIANLTNLNSWRDSEIIQLPNDPDNQSITYQGWQIDLRAIDNQENAGLAITVRFEYGLDGHSMRIDGHETTYNGKAPKNFNQESEEVDVIKDALIQAMLIPQVLS